jgi:anthranilate phosphoribosyltransferase
VLEGELGAFRDVAIMNAAAALIVAGKARLITEGVNIARESIDSGRALKALDTLVTVSNG